MVLVNVREMQHLEEIAVALNIRKDHYKLKQVLTLKEIKRTSQLVSQLDRRCHTSQIKRLSEKTHLRMNQGFIRMACLKNTETYEIITPELVGVNESSIVLGKHSGRHAFKEQTNGLGFAGEVYNSNKSFDAFKDLCDVKKK